MPALEEKRELIEEILMDFKEEIDFLWCALLHEDGGIFTYIKSQKIDEDIFIIRVTKIYETINVLDLLHYDKKTTVISLKQIGAKSEHVLFNSFCSDVVLIGAFKSAPQLDFVLSKFNTIINLLSDYC